MADELPAYAVPPPLDLAAQLQRSEDLVAQAAALRVKASAVVATAVEVVAETASRHAAHPRTGSVLSDAGSVPVPVPPMPFSRIVTRARLRAVRREIGIAAAGAGLADQVTAGFVLAVQELMTNAVRHGGGWARVRLHRSGSALVCVVSDRGPGLTGDPRRVGTLAGARSAGGRGLFLAREMTDSLEVRSGPSGVTVTVTMGLPG